MTAQAVNQVAPRIYEIRPGLILKIDSGFFYVRVLSRAECLYLHPANAALRGQGMKFLRLLIPNDETRRQSLEQEV